MVATQKSIVAGLVGVAMVASVAFALTANRAHASSNSELVELLIAAGVIPADKVAAARAAVSGSTSNVPATSYSFTRNLKVGDTGVAVQDLQKLLNAKGFTVALSGAGSVGNESQYYGKATAAAVSKFQEAYASEILTPAGLTRGTGFFGAATRAKANSLYAGSTPVVPGVTPSTPGLTGGEANVTNYKRATSPSNVEVQQGDSAQVAGFQFDVKNADVAVKRVVVDFEQTGIGSLKPWRYFDSVDVYVDGKKVDTVSASSESDWVDLAGNNRYEITLNADAVVKEGRTGEVTIGVNLLSKIDTADSAAVWAVSLPSNGLRLRDGAGIDSYSTSQSARTFRLKAASNSSDELRLGLDSANPAASTIKVDTNVSTRDVAILVLDLTAKDDINIRTLPVLLTTSGDISTVLSDIKLEVNGSVVGNLRSAITTGSTSTAYFDFDSNEFKIAAGDKATVKVLASFSPRTTANYPEATTIKAEVNTTQKNLILSDTNTTDIAASSQITGTAIGEVHHLLTKGIYATISSTSNRKLSEDTNGANQIYEYQFVFDLTAFQNTYYISATSTATVNYSVIDNTTGLPVTLGATVGTSTSALSSSATRTGDAYQLNDGSKKSFTFTATYDTQTSGYYRIQINSIDFGDSATDTLNQTAHIVTPAADFQSGNVYIKA